MSATDVILYGSDIVSEVIMEISKYPSILHLGRRGTETIFNDPVTIQEKLDGSQMRFGFDDRGTLRFYSRGREQTEADKLFAPAIEAIREKAAYLSSSAVYYGEVLARPKHNILAYSRTPRSNFALFDVYLYGGWAEPHLVTQLAEAIGFEPIPNLHIGPASANDLENLLKTSSCLGGIMEGVVIKNYARGIFAKYVSTDFQEIKGTPKGPKPEGSTLDEMARTLAQACSPEARMHKALAHLRDDGLLLDGPEDIGPIIRAVQADVLEECADYCKDQLFESVRSKILKIVGARTATWYKERLAKVGSATEEFYILPNQETISGD